MNVNLIYFSQSGNTHKVAVAMAEAFRKSNHSIVIHSLYDVNHQEVIDCDLLGVGSPCFSSQAPSVMKDFLMTLPSLEMKTAFVFATMSGAAGRVLTDLKTILTRKGANVVAGLLIRGQVTHPAPHMSGRLTGHPDKKDLEQAQRFALSVARHVGDGHTTRLAGFSSQVFEPGWSFYEMVGLVSTDPIVRLLLPEPKPGSENCDLCDWCVSECPVQNITLYDIPRVGDKCIRCYHCLTECPQQAFTADWRFADPFLWVLYNAKFLRWFGNMNGNELIA